MTPRTRVPWCAPFQRYLCRLQFPLLLHLLLSTLQGPPAQVPACSVSAGRPLARPTAIVPGQPALIAVHLMCAAVLCLRSGACQLSHRRLSADAAQHAGDPLARLSSVNRGMHESQVCCPLSAWQCSPTPTPRMFWQEEQPSQPCVRRGSPTHWQHHEPFIARHAGTPTQTLEVLRGGRAVPHNDGGPDDGHNHQGC